MAIPQNEMSAFSRIEGAEGGHGTPAERKVGEVGVFEARRSST
jgi:hypothetical protein